MASTYGEGAVYESWAEEPLRGEEPCCRNEGVAGKTPDVVGLFLGGWWVCGKL